MKDKKRIPISGDPIVWTSPFAALKNVGLPSTPDARQDADSPAQTDSTPAAPTKNRGRVDIIRQTAHRGGKTVTVVTGFLGIGQAEKNRLTKEIQQACGAGGTVKEGRIEIQGDQRETVARILTNAGFRPVFAGG
jgi:translation initiation factor 1